MSVFGRYALIGILVVVLGVTVLWMLLDDSERVGVILAAFIAYPVQVFSFWLLLCARGEPTRFMFYWGIGIMLRVLTVVTVGLVSWKFELMEPAALLLTLVGFFFVLLLMEPAFLKIDSNDPREKI